MKRIVFILLTITALAIMCIGCSKTDESPLVVPLNPVTMGTAITSQPDTMETIAEVEVEGEVEVATKCENVNNRYSLLATTRFYGMNMETADFKFREATINEDVDTLNGILNIMGQTIIVLPHNNQYLYDSNYDTIWIEENDNTVELSISASREAYVLDEEFIAEESLDYKEHSGKLYVYFTNGKSQFVYMGFTKSEVMIVAESNQKAMLQNVLADVMVFESSTSTVIDANTYMNNLESETQIATYCEDSHAILCFNAADKYKCETDDNNICLLNDDDEYCFYIEFIDSDYAAEETSSALIDTYESYEQVKYIETQTIFGFAFFNDEEITFYGFDKNSHGAVLMEGEVHIDDLLEIIQSTNIVKSASAISKEAFIVALNEKDKNAVLELTNAYKLLLADQDCWDEIRPYVCDGNKSSYVAKSTDLENAKIYFDCCSNHYYYGDDSRTGAGMYSVGGNMKGVTITFYPMEQNGEYYYSLSDGIINEFVRFNSTTQNKEDCSVVYDGDIPDYKNHGLIKNMGMADRGRQYTNNAMRALLGDYIYISSPTHKDVPLTIFITMHGPDDYVHVYAQFGGESVA